MFKRLMSVMKAWFNKGMDQLETPEVLAEQAEGELEASLKKIKNSLTDSLTREKMLDQQIKKNAEELDTWVKRATVAVQNNNDEVARQCLVKKEECTQMARTLEAQLAEGKQTTASLREKLKEIERKVQEFQLKKKELLSRQKASQAAESVAKITTSGGSMDKWEEKIRMKEARSEAMKEMAAEDKLKNEFKAITVNSDIDDELAALKEQVGQPKLIQVSEDSPKLLEDKKDDKKK